MYQSPSGRVVGLWSLIHSLFFQDPYVHYGGGGSREDKPERVRKDSELNQQRKKISARSGVDSSRLGVDSGTQADLAQSWSRLQIHRSRLPSVGVDSRTPGVDSHRQTERLFLWTVAESTRRIAGVDSSTIFTRG